MKANNNKGDYQIPFDEDGNQLDYDGYSKPVYRPNFEFEDTLEFVNYGRGRSSVTFTMRRSDGTTVSMFVSDFTASLRHMVKGQLRGRFTFVKKGQNFGCKMIAALD